MSDTVDALIGPAAGVTTSVFWTLTSLVFTAAARRIGATLVNATRLFLAVVMLAVTYRALEDGWFPALTAEQSWALALSGILGLSICDQCLFTAFVDIGPRRTLLVMTTSPLFALGFGALFMDEHVDALALLGIGMTLGGVLWVLLERQPVVIGGRPADHRLRGVLLAFAGAALQAAGAWLGKRGLGHGLLPPDEHLSAQAATYVRMVWGAAGLLPLLVFAGARRRSWTPVDPRTLRVGLALASLGAVFGPYLGVWASVIAFDRTSLGVAQTLCSLSPVMILPFVMRFSGERVGRRALLGALLAVSGSALLFI